MSHNDFEFKIPDIDLTYSAAFARRKRLLKLLVVLIILQAPTPKKIADELFEFV